MRLIQAASAADRLPLPGDAEQAARGLESWHERAAETADPALAGVLRALADDSTGARLLTGVFGSSPFLTQAMLAEPSFIARLDRDGPDATVAGVLAEVAGLAGAEADQARVMRGLRIARRRIAVAVGLADLTGAWTLEQVTGALSAFAEAAVSASVRLLLGEAAAAGHIELPDPADAARGSGYFVLAMGKLGARELNYSSDIDLIVLYDESRVRYVGKEDPGACFVRVTRRLVRMLEERTPDGYVFRTDLRLRPDPYSTPLAVSGRAAEAYYESMGQNWERAAMIKARPIAGDHEAGLAFLRFLRPFVWRRHLDFAAVQDIHSIKRQIVSHRGGGTVAVAGHNVKLGRGGIREIEFFAQTQQLIWGGREPSLRVAPTLPALDALVAAGRVEPATRDALAAAYRYLRAVEHRLQMVADRQTHSLPESPAELDRFARFLGYPDTAAFEAELVAVLRAVEAGYAGLFEEAPSLGAEPGSLVFTGTDPDPETLATLRGLGFREVESIWAAISNWHRGRYRATRSTRARELLTELKPRLLRALAGAGDPDAAFMRFDAFLAALPAGVQLFSLFHANPWLLDFMATVMGSAPRLAEILALHPIRIEALLVADCMAPIPDQATLAGELARALAQARDFTDVLDLARRWANDQQFRLGIQILRHATDADSAGPAFSDLAEATVAGLIPAVEAAFEAAHGRVPGGAHVVVALGKLGSREMTVGSDLDIVSLYDAPDGVEGSDGTKPLAVSTYYMRLNQRLVNALTAPTGEGKLYEVDLRLRPSGNKGPLAVSLEGFRHYHREEAWTWEHMALTRARAVAGDPDLARRVEDEIRAVLTRPRDPDRLLADVAEMRRRMIRERGKPGPWDVRHRRGGLVDCEFVAQYLQLRHARANPEVLAGNTTTAFARLAAAGLLDGAAADDLDRAVRLWRRVLGFLRLTIGAGAAVDAQTAAYKADLARTAGAADFAALQAAMDTAAERAYAQYRRLIDDPAEAPADSAAARSGA